MTAPLPLRDPVFEAIERRLAAVLEALQQLKHKVSELEHRQPV